MLGLYQFTPFKTLDRDEIREVSDFSILDTDDAAVKKIRAAVKTAEIVSGAVLFARTSYRHPPTK
jgi:leucyl aminopeptidase